MAWRLGRLPSQPSNETSVFASLVALALLAVAFFRPGNMVLYLGFAFMSFGTLAIIPPSFVGGTTILASAITFLALAGQQSLKPMGTQWMLSGITRLGDLGLLFLFTIWAVLGAFFLPRAFQGEILVYPMRALGLVSYAAPLQPTSSNINQALNLVIDCGVAAAVYAMSRRPGFIDSMKRALLIGGVFVVITGLADFLTASVGLGGLLDPFRTASYVLMADSEVAGARRLIGLMAEASGFGSVAVSLGALLFFTRYSYDVKTRVRYVYPISLVCLVMALMSTSSTAYAALAVFFALHLLDILWRMMFGLKKFSGPLFYEIILSFMALLLLVSVVAAWAEAQATIMSMLDSIIFNKKQSSSYLERSAWTNQAFQAFWESNGVGIGVGGARTSNFFVNILASTGVLGVLLFGLFIARVFFARIPRECPEEFELVHGFKLTLFVAATVAALAGTTPDYGTLVACIFGVCVGLATHKLKGDTEAPPL